VAICGGSARGGRRAQRDGSNRKYPTFPAIHGPPPTPTAVLGPFLYADDQGKQGPNGRLGVPKWPQDANAAPGRAQPPRVGPPQCALEQPWPAPAAHNAERRYLLPGHVEGLCCLDLRRVSVPGGDQAEHHAAVRYRSAFQFETLECDPRHEYTELPSRVGETLGQRGYGSKLLKSVLNVEMP